MPSIVKKGLWFALVLVLAVPVAFVLSLLLYPLWSWVESAWGIEAIGHSGPAEWCFVATYAVLVAIAGSVVVRS